MNLLVVFVLMVFLHSLVSRRLERTVLTAPILFTFAGILAVLFLPDMAGRIGGGEVKTFLHIAEIGLVLLLFTDAGRSDLTLLRNIRSVPFRLLSVGMLLTLALGALAALVVFPGLSFWQAGILAAILAPTDAGLGQVIVNSPHVPAKIRQALNVEAGLNDGLSVPFLLFFIALPGGMDADGHTPLTQFILEQLGYGAAVGLGIGLLGGWLLGVAHRRRWMAHSWQQLAVVSLPVLCLLVSEHAGASMFIAAFVAGLAVQVGFKNAAKHSIEFTEGWGQLLNLAVFFLFGILVMREWPEFQWSYALYALTSLTIVRMLPVAIALKGLGFDRATVLFMGWFGPRGLASIVLGLVYIEQRTLGGDDPTIRMTVMVTVLMSIFAHGLSARPGIENYSRVLKILPPTAPELEEVS